MGAKTRTQLYVLSSSLLILNRLGFFHCLFLSIRPVSFSDLNQPCHKFRGGIGESANAPCLKEEKQHQWEALYNTQERDGKEPHVG